MIADAFRWLRPYNTIPFTYKKRITREREKKKLMIEIDEKKK